MSSALVDLVAIGAQDAYIKGEPKMTYFKQAYKQHTNFAMEPVRQVIEGAVSGGNWSTIRVGRAADLASYIWLAKRDGTDFAVDGSDLFEEIELRIGGQLIVDMDFEEANALSGQFANSTSVASLCPVEQQTAFFMLPLFCGRDSSLALPMLALTGQEVTVRIKWAAGVSGLVEAWINDIYIDKAERDQFLKSEITMLIEQFQRVAISAGESHTDLPFNNPVKAIFWSPGIMTDADGVSIEFNGKKRVRSLPEQSYYGGVQIAAHTEHYDGAATIYPMYSFALHANRTSPSGSCNFSRIEDARISWEGGADAGGIVHAFEWNVLRISGGVGGMMFSN